MSEKLVGMRVYAVQESTPREVQLVGFGTYVGMRLRTDGLPLGVNQRREIERSIQHQDKQPDLDIERHLRLRRSHLKTSQEITEAARQFQARQAEDRALPMETRVQRRVEQLNSRACIHLDSGYVVWGDQVAWGPLDRWERYRRDREIVTVRIPTDTERWRDDDGAADRQTDDQGPAPGDS